MPYAKVEIYQPQDKAEGSVCVARESVRIPSIASSQWASVKVKGLTSKILEKKDIMFLILRHETDSDW